MIPFLDSGSKSDAFKLCSAWVVDLCSFSNRGLGSSWLYPWYSSSLRRLVSAVSAGCCIRRDCVDDVGCIDEVDDGNDDVRPAGAAAVGSVASGLDDVFASGFSLSLSSERRLDFLTECMVDTLRRWPS
jgi:hypothetical protein